MFLRPSFLKLVTMRSTFSCALPTCPRRQAGPRGIFLIFAGENLWANSGLVIESLAWGRGAPGPKSDHCRQIAPSTYPGQNVDRLCTL